MKSVDNLFVELTSEEASMISGGSWLSTYITTMPKDIGNWAGGYFRRIKRWF